MSDNEQPMPDMAGLLVEAEEYTHMGKDGLSVTMTASESNMMMAFFLPFNNPLAYKTLVSAGRELPQLIQSVVDQFEGEYELD